MALFGGCPLGETLYTQTHRRPFVADRIGPDTIWLTLDPDQEPRSRLVPSKQIAAYIDFVEGRMLWKVLRERCWSAYYLRVMEAASCKAREAGQGV